GFGNIASAQDATIAGGSGNTANGFRSGIGGGNGNFVALTGTNAFIGGGTFNTASGAYSTVSGGYGNTASAYAATVPGGELNQAGGNDSLAAGCHANANNAGAFVWADNTCTDFSSTANNQFLVKATGGVGIGTNAPVAQLHVSSGGDNFFPALRLSQTNPNDYVRVRLTNDATSPADGYNNRWDMAAISTTFLIYSGKDNQSALRLTPADPTYYMLMGNLAYLTHGGTWTNASDKNLKANFAAVDNNDVLARVRQLPLTTWSYKAEPESVRHLGPMAQDFRAAFGLGADDKSITTVDESGVALAAIQGLAHENDDLRTKNALLEARVTSQQRQLDAVNARLAALEQNSPSNALTLNALAPWGVVGLVAVWAMRRKTTYK
ncbi:MAG TPA: tail fiber domain-containing protein, partial [Anaerolineae bacterium]